MPRSERRLDTDSGYADGHIFIPVLAANITTGAGGTEVSTYNGIATAAAAQLGTAATAYTATIPLNGLLFRYGVQDDLQNFFGTANPTGAQGLPVGSPQTLSTGSSVAGSNISVAVLSSIGFTAGTYVVLDTVASGVQETALVNAIPDATHIQFAVLKNAHTTPFPLAAGIFTTPAGVSGSPPYTGITQFTPVTAPRPKGVLFKALYPVFSIANGVAAPTVNTIGLVSTTFANAAATTTANVVAVAANGMPTAANAANQAYVTPIPVPVAAQVFRTTRYTEFVIQWNVTTGAATGTAGLFGVFADITFNYN